MDFLPIGFQYYRAPTPEKCFWESDLRKMHEQGFNTVKYWVQWRWSERKEGVFDFSDLDELMDLAHKYGLKVILNLILDVAPVWFTRKYPDADFISLGGTVHRPMAINCRQIGGVPGPCVHHPEGNMYRRRFTEEMAKHFKNHPALYLYDVWNEPNLNFKSDKRELDSIICYCENSVEEFRGWVANKYGTIERLNEIWGKCYNDFGEVEPPRCIGMSNEFVDWRLFFVDATTKDLRMRVEAVKKHDNVHRVMCHTVPYPIYAGVFNTTDDFALAAECDLFGNSVGSNAFAANMLVDSARGKDVINAEVHMVGGHAITGYIEPDCEDIQKHYLLPLSRGIKGFLVWQYRPESLGDEAPCWGNIDYLGNDRKWQRDCIIIGNLLAADREIILGAAARKPSVAIFYEPKSEYFSYSMIGSTEAYDAAVTGLYDRLYKANKDIRFIREQDIKAGELTFDAIYMPADYCFGSDLTAKLEAFVRGGGTLVLDPLAAMHDENTGRHSPVIPGCGLDELAGVRQISCYHVDKLKPSDFADAERKLFGVKYGKSKLYGGFFRAYYEPTVKEAMPIAYFDNGVAAAWSRSLGAGRVITLGTMLDACDCAANTEFFAAIGSTDEWKKSLPLGVRADILAHNGEGLIIIDNRTDSDFELKSDMLGGELWQLYTIEDGNLYENRRKTDSITAPAGCVRMAKLRGGICKL